MSGDGHTYRGCGPDEVACRYCGHEPWQRPTSCPGNPHQRDHKDRSDR